MRDPFEYECEGDIRLRRGWMIVAFNFEIK